MNNQVFTNPNELTKGEFDELNKVNDFDIFTPKEIAISTLELAKLVKKGEVSELNEDELDIIKSGTAELKNLKKYTINEMIQGRIIKNDVYVQPKQVKWLDVIEKSENGEKIEKGIYLDTELNRELGRVGITFEKGKKVVKSEEPEKKDNKKEEKDEEVNETMFKAVLAAIKKGDLEKKELYKAMSEDMEDEEEKSMLKKCMKKAYKSLADEMNKAAEDDFSDENEGKEKK
jgi:hypothetical protein